MAMGVEPGEGRGGDSGEDDLMRPHRAQHDTRRTILRVHTYCASTHALHTTMPSSN